VGAVTGIAFIDHPKGGEEGVVVSKLAADGACAKAGVRVGDHIVKINGTRPTNRDHAVALCDHAWTAAAQEGDKNTDRLKFSLHRRTQDFAIGKRQTSTLSAPPLMTPPLMADGGVVHDFEGLSVSPTVSVEVLGGSSGSSMASAAASAVSGAASAVTGLLGGRSAQLEATGLLLEDSPAGYGALVTSVTPDSLAHISGVEAGVTIVSVDGALCEGDGVGAKGVAKMIDAARAKNGTAHLVAHLKKSKEDNEHI
jgi:membrane-associated protease RseP (regulator of RpoE activity)